MTKNYKVISKISLVLVPANICLVPANIFLQKGTGCNTHDVRLHCSNRLLL